MKAGIDPDRIDPEFLLDLSDPVEGVYAAIEHDLIVNIARRFRGGDPASRAAVPGSDAWRGYMLEQVGGLSNENIRTIAAYTGDASEATQLAIRTSVETAIAAVEPELARAASQPGYVPAPSETTERVLGAYTAQALNRQNLVNTVMLNSSLRAYDGAVRDVYAARLGEAQKTLNAETGAAILGAKSGSAAVRGAIRRLAETGLTGFTDARGRNWTPEAYVNMDVKTTAANAARQAAMDRNEAHGNNLIAVSSHPGARPKCEPYQGKVYSTDGTSGTAHDLNGSAIPYTPLSATSYGEPDGLFGINCGHFPSPFLDGLSLQRYTTYDHEETTRLYKESQEQRFMERKIRRKRTAADALAAAGDKEGAKAVRLEVGQMTADLRDWCEGHGRSFDPERIWVGPRTTQK